MLEVKSVSISSYSTNCYLLRDTISGETAAVDCAVFDDDYKSFIQENGVSQLKYILVTHGHFDHICGVKPLKDALGGEICIHEKDAPCLTNAKYSLSEWANFAPQQVCNADKALPDGSELFLGDHKITLMFTPGHTRGSAIFLCDDIIFSGDTLFRASMGRTDLPGGSTKMIFESLKKIGQLDGDYTIYPGHGVPTTLLFEKKYNRYLKADDFIHN